MKKLIALICLLAMILPLCACAAEIAPVADSEQTPAAQTKTEAQSTPAKQEETKIEYPKDVFTIGFGREDISGPLPVEVYEGTAEVVGDPLMLSCVAVCDGETVALLIATDTRGISRTAYNQCAKQIEKKFGIPGENVIINTTHSHAAPSIGSNDRWMKNFYQKLLTAVEESLLDLAPATAYAGESATENMAFVRRYLMPDGTYKTHGDKTAVAHETEADRSLRTIRFDREGDKKDILLVNWQSHYMGGMKKSELSADVFGNFRELAEKELDMHFAYFSGSSGNINFNSPIPGEKTIHSRDDAARELVRATRDAMAGEKLVQTGEVKTAHSVYQGVVLHDTEERVAQAKEITKAGRDSAKGKELIAKYGFSSKYEATAVVKRSELGETVDMNFFAVTFGDIAFSTAPFEQFDTNGKQVRDGSPFPVTFTLSLTNETHGYIPSYDAYPHKGYEVSITRFVQGSGEKFAEEQIRLLNECKNAA